MNFGFLIFNSLLLMDNVIYSKQKQEKVKIA